MTCEASEIDNNITVYVEYYEQDQECNFAIIELDTSLLTLKELKSGIYEGLFPALLSKFKRIHPLYRILLLDVVTVLLSSRDADNYQIAIENVHRDSECLILPVVPVELNMYRTEYSAILDGACFSSVKRFIKAHSDLSVSEMLWKNFLETDTLIPNNEK